MLDLGNFQGLEEETLVDTAEGRRYLLVSSNGTHVKLAPGAYQLVRGVYAGRTFEDLAREFSDNSGLEVSRAEIEAAYSKVAELLADIASQDRRNLQLPAGFWLRVRLIPERAVAKVASIMAVAYRPVLAAALLVFIAVTFSWMSLQRPVVEIEGTTLWVGYLLFVLTLVFHEFGHASACAYYGARPSDIGFALYLVYPAFYSDVTSAWRLSRWQRVAVDLGGTFFQFAITGVIIVAYARWQLPELWIAFGLVVYGALFSLNPIFKFDGYWVLADALGVTHLSKQPGILVRQLVNRLRGMEVRPLPWSSRLITVLVLYSVLAVFVWGYFLIQILPWIAGQVGAMPSLVAATWRAFAVEGWSDALRQQIAMLSANVFLLSVVAFALWRLVRMPAKRLHSWWIIRRAHREAAREKLSTLETQA